MTASQQLNRKFRILCLDGGGIRGAFLAAFLAVLEEQLPHPLASYFDLIAGTSTGAIVAAGLAFEKQAAAIRDFYRLEGPKIFSQSCWDKGIFQSKYKQNDLAIALHRIFGEKRMQEAKCRLIIPAVNISYGQTTVFKTHHLPNMIRDPKRLVVDVLLATTAAPYFFPQARLEDGIYIDGGLWANSPSMIAYCEAIKIRKHCKSPHLNEQFELEDIQILSIGTGKPKYYLKPGIHETGLLWWLRNRGREFLNITGACQSQGCDFQSQYVLGSNYTRVDFDIPRGFWQLDAVEHVDDLINFGKQKAVEEFNKLKAIYFTNKAPTFYPYASTTI